MVDAVDAILAGETRQGPMDTEVLKPLLEIAEQVALLRDGRLGPLTVEQRQALSLVHGKLGHVLLTLRQLVDGTNIPAAGEVVDSVAVYS